MTVIAKDFNPNGIEWTCNFCNKDRTFRAGQRKPAYGADPCPVCGGLRKPYTYPTEAEVAGFCLEAPPRVLRVLPPTNAGFTPDGNLTEEMLEYLACDPQRV